MVGAASPRHKLGGYPRQNGGRKFDVCAKSRWVEIRFFKKLNGSRASAGYDKESTPLKRNRDYALLLRCHKVLPTIGHPSRPPIVRRATNQNMGPCFARIRPSHEGMIASSGEDGTPPRRRFVHSPLSTAVPLAHKQRCLPCLVL